MKPEYKTISSFLLAVLLSACTGLQQIPPRPALMTPEEFSGRSLDNKELERFMQKTGAGQTRPRQWDFKHLYWAAIYYNPDLAEVKAQFNAANAATITAGQSPNPSINLGPAYDHTPSPSAWLLGVGLNIPIETNGKRSLRIAAAQQQSMSAQSLLISKAWDIRNKVLNALIDIQIADELIARTQALADIQGQISEIYTKRIDQGQLPTAMASQNQILYQQSLLQIQQAKTGLMQAQAVLAGAIGVPISAVQQIKIGSAYPVFKPLKASRQKILLEHPAVLSAFYDYRAAHENLRLELAKQVPDIALGPGYEWNSQQGGKYTLGLSFTLPIINRNEGPIAEAAAKRELAARHFDAIQITAINAMEQAEATYQSTNREMNEANRIVRIQQDKEKRLNTLIQQDNVGSLPFLYARSETGNAQIVTLVTKAKLLHAEATLENTIRQPLFGPVISQDIVTRK